MATLHKGWQALKTAKLLISSLQKETTAADGAETRIKRGYHCEVELL